MTMEWRNPNTLKSINYTCGFCDEAIASNIGYFTTGIAQIRICHFCGCPTYFPNIDNPTEAQVPGSPMGHSVKNIDNEDLNKLYEEARQCGKVNAYTAAVLACRKILMHIAVDNEAPEGKKFIEYVEYLSEKNYVPPGAEGWVDYIRKKGNEANHEIVLMEEKDAENLINFIEMLLKVIYDFPARIPKSPKDNNPD